MVPEWFRTSSELVPNCLISPLRCFHQVFLTNIGRESETVEFNESIAQLDKGIRSLTAMLNRHQHGSLFIGVNNGGEVIGMDIGSRTKETIRSRIRDIVKVQVIPEIIEHVTDDGKSYIEVRVIGYNTPYSCDDRYYIRNVSSDESAGPEILEQIIMSKKTDPLMGYPSKVQELTFNSLFNALTTSGLRLRNDANFFRVQGMMNEHGQYNLTAYLVSDQNDEIIQVVRFKGTDRSSISKRTNFGGQSLIASAKAVLSHVSSLMMTEVDLSSKGEMVETDLFDFESFREAWINACVHNNWHTMDPPAVMIFDNRIEIVSNGHIPFPMSQNDFYEGSNHPVNPSLFQLFMLTRLVEHGGHGVPIIVRHYGKEAFKMTDMEIVVTIPFTFIPEYVKAERESDINLTNMDPAHSHLLVYLGSHPEVKLSDAAEELGMSYSSVKKAVALLKSEGRLRNDGTNRNSRWTVL